MLCVCLLLKFVVSVMCMIFVLVFWVVLFVLLLMCVRCCRWCRWLMLCRLGFMVGVGWWWCWLVC